MRPATIKVEAASCRFPSDSRRPEAASNILFQAFDFAEPIENLSGNLPHWRQPGRTYFVTYRTADSLPRVKLEQWKAEREDWLRTHPKPHTDADRREYFDLFPQRFQDWLDQGYGACALAQAEISEIVAEALRHFDGERYELGEYIVMPNHVHVLLTPIHAHELSQILHSWKSFTANAINKRLHRTGSFWQKESFDHIVRNADALEKFADYIRENAKSRR